MAPKKEKDRVDDNYWRSYIEDAPLNEDTWNVKVIIFEAASSSEDHMYLNKFEAYAKQEKRFVIKNICKSETIFMVNQLGGEKKVRDENLRVFEEGHKFLKDKKDIPADILALIIKQLILQMKEEYLFIKSQKIVVKEGLRRESLTLLDKGEKKDICTSVPVRPAEVVESPPTKQKGKKSEIQPKDITPQIDESKKYSTLLRVRGEEWRDKVYIDDFPIDGPNLYVAITEFMESDLLQNLLKINVPIVAVVQIRIDSRLSKVPSGVFTTNKRGLSNSELTMQKTIKYWETFEILRIDNVSADDLKNVAFITFSPPYKETEPISNESEKIYDDLCYLMYDIQDLTRQHANYLNSMDVTQIPPVETNENFLSQYQRNIYETPLECVTVFSVVDSLLQAICTTFTSDNNSCNSTLSTAMELSPQSKNFIGDEKSEKARALIGDVFETLNRSNSYKNTYRVTCGEEYESHKDPIFINYGDLIKSTNFHVDRINLDSVVMSSLLHMPIYKLWKYQPILEENLQAKVDFHINTLLSCFDREVETSELRRLIHILSFRQLFNNRSSLKKPHLPSNTLSEFKKIYLKRSGLVERLAKKDSFFWTCGNTSQPRLSNSVNSTGTLNEDNVEIQLQLLFDCPDISQLVSATEIVSNKPINHMIENYDFFEDFTGICAFQMLLEGYNQFNCLNYKYCEVTDCFLILLFNSHDKDGIYHDEWHSHLPTPVCLQDFFDFILEEELEWIQNEEKIYDENLALQTETKSKDSIHLFATKSCLENVEVDLELLINGSLKHQEIVKLGEAVDEVTDDNYSTKNQTLSPTVTDVDTKNSRKTKSAVSENKHNYSVKQMNVKEPIITTSQEIDYKNRAQKKKFPGYDLGDRRVEVFGKNSIYFSKDGTKICSYYTISIPTNFEYITLNVTTGNGCNEFWMHKILGDLSSVKSNTTSESFRIVTKDQVIIYIKRISVESSANIIQDNSINKLKNIEKISKSNLKRIDSGMNTANREIIFHEKIFHSFVITWANGLIIESVHENYSSNLSYIKQFYINPMTYLNEDMRCISLNGEVIIFNKSGEIEVLKCDGSYIKITKCEKRLICPVIQEDKISDTNSDKIKKVKNKDKIKDKLSRVVSKSSKNVIHSNENVSVTNQINYELCIDEFETIESNGLWQNWANDKVINVKPILIKTATDFCLGEILSKRMDGTNILLNKDGVQIITFPNSTRIITQFYIEDNDVYPDWTESDSYLFESDYSLKGSLSQKSYINVNTDNDSLFNNKSSKFEIKKQNEKNNTGGYISIHMIYTIEHVNFATVTINKGNGEVTVDSPKETSVTINSENSFKFKLDNATSATFDGEHLDISYEACPQCQSNTECSVKIGSNECSSNTKLNGTWLKMKDSFCKKVIVSDEGEIKVENETCDDDVEVASSKYSTEFKEEQVMEKKSETSLKTHGKCMNTYEAKAMRFFVLQRDLSCSELVHRILVDEYQRNCRWQPWCSINEYDTFKDHRSILSMLTPLPVTETEKWLIESKYSNKPQHLKYKDLKEDTGKGFYHWMRPYNRFTPKPSKPANVKLPRLPRAYVLRTLERQWNDDNRETMKGARELLIAVLRYRQLMESNTQQVLSVPIRDPRTEEERKRDEILQDLAHRIYEDTTRRHFDDVRDHAELTITTKPKDHGDETSVLEEGEIEGTEAPDKGCEEERAELVEEVERVASMSPALQRYWRCRTEEAKEEQFYKYVLRSESVPPYFRNILGGAIWWEVNEAAGEAVNVAEEKINN